MQSLENKKIIDFIEAVNKCDAYTAAITYKMIPSNSTSKCVRLRSTPKANNDWRKVTLHFYIKQVSNLKKILSKNIEISRIELVINESCFHLKEVKDTISYHNIFGHDIYLTYPKVNPKKDKYELYADITRNKIRCLHPGNTIELGNKNYMKIEKELPF